MPRRDHALSAPALGRPARARGLSRYTDRGCKSQELASTRSSVRRTRRGPVARPRPKNVILLGRSQHDLPPLPSLRPVSERKRAAVARIQSSHLFGRLVQKGGEAPSGTLHMCRRRRVSCVPGEARELAAAPGEGRRLVGVAMLLSKAPPMEEYPVKRAQHIRNCEMRGRTVDVLGRSVRNFRSTAHPYPGPAVAAPPPAVY